MPIHKTLVVGATKKTNLADAIAARVRELRLAKGWSQERLAGETGLSKDAVSRIERGDRGPRLDTLERIAVAVGIPLPQLVDVEGGIAPNGAEHKRTLLLQRSLEQLEPWLANALPVAINAIVRASRNRRRRVAKRRPSPRRKRGLRPPEE